MFLSASVPYSLPWEFHNICRKYFYYAFSFKRFGPKHEYQHAWIGFLISKSGFVNNLSRYVLKKVVVIFNQLSLYYALGKTIEVSNNCLCNNYHLNHN